jgi:glutathionylspermidine synthase
MKRQTLASVRKNWKTEMNSLGFTYHTIDGDKYWTEDAYYEFSAAQVDQIYDATKELTDMCFKAVQYVIDKNLFDKLSISPDVAAYITKTWNEDAPTLYGRFDLGWDGKGQIKMYEFNADTPTSLMEASLAQWYWKQAYFPDADQFNSLHETLQSQFEFIRENHMGDNLRMHFTCETASEEDTRTTYYLRDVAKAAGIDARFISIHDIGYSANEGMYVDMDDQEITSMFKLYPWEWIVDEEFGKFRENMHMWLEPVWKMVLSNKGILPILWEMYPNHPLLLEAYFDDGTPTTLKDYVKKPILSREGANIELHSDTVSIKSDGVYGEEGFVYQQLYLLPEFGGRYPVIGSWVIGDEPSGMGIREDDSPITKNTSNFVPHIFSK